MADDQTFFVLYSGPMTATDLAALECQGGLTVYEGNEDGVGVSDAWMMGAEPPPTTFDIPQVVKLAADDERAAMQRIVDVLGREPKGLTAVRLWN
jgi:hypothetical protein